MWNSRARVTRPRIAAVCLVGLLTSLFLTGLAVVLERSLPSRTLLACTPLSCPADWTGDWELSELGADPGESGSLRGTDRVTIPFVVTERGPAGADFALRVRRGPYRAHLFVAVDGQPADRLPQDERGAYIVLTSPDYKPQVVTITVAGGLEQGPHTALVIADRGWDQWPLVGWSVSVPSDATPYRRVLAACGILGALSLSGLICVGEEGLRACWRSGEAVLHRTSGLFRCRLWGDDKCARGTGFLNRPVAGLVILLAAGGFYFSPWPLLTLLCGLLLAAFIILRLDWGLALVAATAPFYLHPRPLFGKAFSMAELLTLLCLLSWTLRGKRCLSAISGVVITCPAACRRARLEIGLPGRLRRRASACADAETAVGAGRPLAEGQKRATSVGMGRQLPGVYVDAAIAFFVLVSLISALTAEYRHVALRELRVVVLEPALFYLMLRTARLEDREVWRVVDLFVLGGVAVALIGMVQYIAGVNLITAEDGLRRLRSVYGSPNNAALYLGRVLPIAVAVSLFGTVRRCRVMYGLAALPLGLGILLTFSKGALILGLPLSLLALLVLAGGRWRRLSVGVVAVVGVVLALFLLLRVSRFLSLFDIHGGTTFFRLSLWRSSGAMLRDYPWLGVGPDNFLYHYRSRYILPAAWQEPDLSHPHNFLLDYGCRLGLWGVAAALCLQAAFWHLALPLHRLMCQEQRALAIGTMGLMVNFLAHGLVDASYFVIDLAFAFFLAFAVVQWLAGGKRGESEE